MSLIFYDGPSFSGRSDALRNFAWEECLIDKKSFYGQYIHPLLEINLGGFASTVGGEAYSHGLVDSNGNYIDCHDCPVQLTQLLTGLPPNRRLSDLCGGELVRLIIACNIALRPTRLALDCTLEQLDCKMRPEIAKNILAPLNNIDIHIADNIKSDIFFHLKPTGCKSFEKSIDAPDLFGSLENFVNTITKRTAQAPAIQLANLSFKYPNGLDYIFKNTNFTFEPENIYHLQAPNGSGKTTLARLLLGIIKPNKGSIFVNNNKFKPWKDKRNLLFYAFQNPAAQIFGLYTKTYFHKVSRAAMTRATWPGLTNNIEVEDVIKGFGLSTFSEADLFDLPFLVKKWITLGASVLSRSPWLFFDEPAIGSDVRGRAAIKKLLQSLCNAGFGIIVVSHGQQFDELPKSVAITIKDKNICNGHI